uniref:Serpentine Receptor, class T n=1 Tax=Caenorhabditis tropicalis TaxID=1561998 RepID=A0A1I7V2Y7_9PELO
MNNIIRYGSIVAIPLYNCSAHTPQEWSALNGVKRPIVGSLEMAYGMILNLMYIPMISVMLEKENFKMSCYKIMSFLTLIDIFALTVNSIITGFLSYQGAVYCTYPNLIYISGMMGLGLWCCSCIIAMSLIINRLLDLLLPSVGFFLFEGNRTFFVLTLPIIYGLYFVFFTTPIAFSSKYLTWFFDPLIFEGKTQEVQNTNLIEQNSMFQYSNFPHFFNNILVVAVTCCLYMLFCCALGAKLKNVDAGSTAQKASTQIFFQSAMICAVNQVASVIYVSMNFIEVPFWLIVLGHVLWELGHGAPAIIYMNFNKTIRNGVLRKLGDKKGTINQSTTQQSGKRTNVSTVI